VICMAEAKAIIAGTVELEMERYPLRSASMAFFGSAPRDGVPQEMSSGSVSMLKIDDKPLILTCSHVLRGYRERLAEGECIFQIGNCKLDPLSQLVEESMALDLAVIGLTNEQALEIQKPGSGFGEFFVNPTVWPPAPVSEGDFVSFGGYPGELRRATSFNELSFGSYSSGASRVTAAHTDYLVCQFERGHWISHSFEPEPSNIRGMSGGPVFAIRQSGKTGIVTHEFIGIIYEFSEDYELLYVRLAHVLDSNGRMA